VDKEHIFQPITASDGMSDNSAQTIICTYSGRMTITTLGNVNFYDGARFSQIKYDEGASYLLEDYNGHSHLYFDNNHHLWLKVREGVTCVNLTEETYITNMDSLFATYGAKSKVKDLFVDINGDVWLSDGNYIFSTKYRKKVALQKGRNLQDLEVHNKQLLFLFYDDGQLFSYDLKAGRKLYHNRSYSKQVAEDFNQSMVQLKYSDGFFVIHNGGKKGILMHYNLSDRKWTEVMRMDFHLNNMTIYQDKLYIASQYGYFTYHLITGEIKHYSTLTLRDGRELQTDVNVIEFDHQGGMWMGTEMRGLLYSGPLTTNFRSMEFDDPQAVTYLEMMKDLEGISEFRGMRSNTLLVDSRKWTWVGTSKGLYLYKTPQDKPVIFSRSNGFLNSVIHSIVEDDMHNIWASTSYGISCLLISGDEVSQLFCFGSADNLPNESFINGKALKLPTGDIVMQSLDHVVLFNPENFKPVFKPKAYVMNTKLTKLMVNGIDVSSGTRIDGSLILHKALSRTREINLNYDQNTVKLTFTAMNYARPLQTFYRVRVKELFDWREYSYFTSRGLVDSRGLLHLPLPSLNPGSYHIEVQASLGPDDFVGNPYKWVVNINEPWWRTSGMMFLLGVLVMALIILNFIVFNRNTRLKMKRNSQEGDLIRTIVAFVNRCDDFYTGQLVPSTEEIYGTEQTSKNELSREFVDVMMKVIPFVHDHDGKTFTIHMLSEVTGLEVLSLFELFTENLHKSPRALIRSLRVDQVAEQLHNTDKSLEQIAHDCGFVSPNYMIATFFHKYRMTPEAYRHMNMNDDSSSNAANGEQPADILLDAMSVR